MINSPVVVLAGRQVEAVALAACRSDPEEQKALPILRQGFDQRLPVWKEDPWSPGRLCPVL